MTEPTLRFLLFRRGEIARAAAATIPRIVHFVPPGGRKFGFIQYVSRHAHRDCADDAELAFASASTVLKPDRILVHLRSGTEPPADNFWWARATALDRIEVQVVDDPTHIFGRPLKRSSHRADVIRLRALLDHGGIYLDSDAFAIRPMDSLLHEQCVLGIEPRDGSDLPRVPIEGLGNSIMLAAPNSSFVRAWLDSYRTFDHRQWSAHSVGVPWQLAKAGEHPVTVLDSRAFFTPMWDDLGLRWIHGTLPVDERSAELASAVEHRVHGRDALELPGWSFERSQQFGYHLWHSALKRRCSVATGGDLATPEQITPDDVVSRDSSFNLHMRRYVSPDLLRDWRAWSTLHPA